MRVLIFLILFSPLVTAQVRPSEETNAINSVVQQFFDGLNKKDTTLIKTTLLPSCRLETTEADGSVKNVPIPAFLKMLVSNPKLILEERIRDLQVNTDGPLAMAWMDYHFFVNEKLSHCGSNLFVLVQDTEGWKVHSIIDSRRKNCD